MPTTCAFGKARPMAIVDQPAPHPTSATRIGDREQAPVNVSRRGNPLFDEIPKECGTVDAGLALAKRRAERRIRHPTAMPVCVQLIVERARATNPGDHLRERREVAWVISVTSQLDYERRPQDVRRVGNSRRVADVGAFLAIYPATVTVCPA